MKTIIITTQKELNKLPLEFLEYTEIQIKSNELIEIKRLFRPITKGDYMQDIKLTGSYVQDKRFTNVSESYNPIQASAVGEAMASHGLTLASLSTGRAKHEDKIDFQRTLARYRGPEISDGVHLDVVYDSKKMGRGVDRILLGIYRMICTNGLFAGSNFFSHDIRHNGKTFDSLHEGIAAALVMQEKLSETITKMQDIELTQVQVGEFAYQAAKLLIPNNALEVKHALTKVRRQSDDKLDLWTIFNVVQENAMHGHMVAYKLPTLDDTGNVVKMREMTTRAIKPNTGKDAGFNQALFDVAMKLAA